MSTADSQEGLTLHDAEDHRSALPAHEALLVHIGSPENEFAGAGAVYPLRGVDVVRFERASGSELEVETVGSGRTGAAPGAQLRLGVPLQWVSARHAELDLACGQAILVDWGSRNGTLIEGRPIRDRRAVTEGDIFEVGRSFWMLRRARAPWHETGGLDPSGTASPSLNTIEHALARIAPSNVPIVLLGETGVGKNVLAEAIHRRAHCPGRFVHANVMAKSVERLLLDDGGVPEGGLLARARGGTLFLDEVGELGPRRQTKLLSALMGHIPARPHAPIAEHDVRIVAASTRDLRHMVATQTFRPDLYARIAGYEARLPALRDRREDLGLLVRRLARRASGEMAALSTEVFREMLGYDWPFNIRELVHALESAVALADPRGVIDMEVWDRALWRDHDVPGPARIQAVRQELLQQLATHDGDTEAVAAALKCDIGDVERWLIRLSLHPEQFAKAA